MGVLLTASVVISVSAENERAARNVLNHIVDDLADRDFGGAGVVGYIEDWNVQEDP